MENGWNEKLGELLSRAVNYELTAFYFYMAAGAHFDSPDISLLNLRDFFYKEGSDEVKHAKTVIKFINQRGLKLRLDGVFTEDLVAQSVVDIFGTAEKLEQKVLDHYRLISSEASKVNDALTVQFIDYFLDKQITEVKYFHDLAKNTERTSGPLGDNMTVGRLCKHHLEKNGSSFI